MMTKTGIQAFSDYFTLGSDNMDIVRFRGGLGNQMFQYVFLRSLELRGRDVYASLGWYGDDYLVGERPFLLESVFSNVNIKIIEESEFDRLNEKWRAIKSNKERYKKYLESDIKDKFF